MIEYTDKVFGKIKVLNVTEARANFANVLSDSDSHYIITKNNKPLRVIINHAEYETLRRVGDSVARDGVIDATPGSVDHLLVEAFTREAIEESVPMDIGQEQSKDTQASKPFENPVKGILAANSELAKTEAPKPKKHKPLAPPLSESSLLVRSTDIIRSEPDKTAQQTLLASQGLQDRLENNDNYFYSAGDSDTDEDDVLIEPEDESDNSSVVSSTVQQKQMAVQHTAKTKEATKSAQATPEESEYFQKYKKLYESVGLGSGNADDDAEFERRLQQKYAKLYSEESKSEAQVTSQHMAHESEDRQTTPGRQSVREMMPAVEDRNKHIEVDDPVNAQNYFTDSDEEESTGLPSLKDLLRDLEDEKLSDETETPEESLNDRDIDDLIERITQD